MNQSELSAFKAEYYKQQLAYSFLENEKLKKNIQDLKEAFIKLSSTNLDLEIKAFSESLKKVQEVK